MIIPNIWENKIDVPNHQPDMLWLQAHIFESTCVEWWFHSANKVISRNSCIDRDTSPQLETLAFAYF